MGRLFGTDGVRGEANIAPMDSETLLQLGRAAAHIFRRSKGRHRILIGKDTRVSGYLLETALSSGIASMGVDVLLVGPIPTPGVAFMTKSMRADAGVMISASHNSYEDNGIKFFGADGYKLPDAMEDEIEQLMKPGALDRLRAKPEEIGKAFRIDDALGRYTVYLKSCLDRSITFDGLKVVLDCAHGAGYKVAPLVFSELGAEVSLVGAKPDGRNINLDCGSTHPELLCKTVVERRADVGIAFDGDADRVLLCDSKGYLIDGDYILAVLAEYFIQSGVLKGEGVVGTVMSNLGLELALKERGLTLYRADVGDRYVLAEMKSRGLNLGGEQSGHIISLDHNTTGDGILTALLMLSAMVSKQCPASEFLKEFERCPQVLVNVKVAKKVSFDSLPDVQKSVKAAEQKLGKEGRVLLRYSGTEAKARVMVEGTDLDECQNLADSIAETVVSAIG